MRILKLKQSGLILGLTLSLVVAAFVGCACAHHQTVVEKVSESTCRTHSPEVKSETAGAESTVTVLTRISPDECFCLQASPQSFAKAETVKVAKQIAAVSQSPGIERLLTAEIPAVKRTAFARRIYLTDSFHNLYSGRAPPRI